MNQNINDVAIKISQEIYRELSYDVANLMENQGVDNPAHIPSFFNVRSKIYDVLYKYIKCYRVEFEHGKFDSRMPKDYRERVLRDMEEKSADLMVRDILEKRLDDYNTYNTEYMQSTRREFLLIDMSEVRKNPKTTEESISIARLD